MTDHFDGCWELESHLPCALARIRELERALAEVERNNPTVSGPVPCFPEPLHDLSDGMYPKTPFVVVGTPHIVLTLANTNPIQRIPGSASWTAPAVDDPPVVLDAEHPHP